MPGKLGAVRTVPKPSAAVVEQALALVVGFGQGTGELAALLTSLRDAHAVNERLVEDARSAIGEAEQRAVAAAAAEREAQEQAERARSEASARDAEVTARARRSAKALSERDANVATREMEIEAARAALDEREVAAAAFEHRLATLKRTLAEREAVLDERERETGELHTEWLAKIEQVRSFAAGLGEVG